MGDAGAQVGDVADDADRAPALAQRVEDGEDLLEAVVVEAAEALVDEERREVEAAGLLPDGVGEAEGEGEGGHEGLAAGQGRRLAAPAGPLVEDAQPEPGARPARGALVGVLEDVAATAHDAQPLVGQRRDLLEPGGEDERGQPHPQRVVGAEATGGVGELADAGVALLERGDVLAGGLEGRAQPGQDPHGAGEHLALGRRRHGGLPGGAGRVVGGGDVGRVGRERGGDLGVVEDCTGGDPGRVVLGHPAAQRVELAGGEGSGHHGGDVGEACGRERLGEVGLGRLEPRGRGGVLAGGADDGVERAGDGGVVGGVGCCRRGTRRGRRPRVRRPRRRTTPRR